MGLGLPGTWDSTGQEGTPLSCPRAPSRVTGRFTVCAGSLDFGDCYERQVGRGRNTAGLRREGLGLTDVSSLSQDWPLHSVGPGPAVPTEASPCTHKRGSFQNKIPQENRLSAPKGRTYFPRDLKQGHPWSGRGAGVSSAWFPWAHAVEPVAGATGGPLWAWGPLTTAPRAWGSPAR